MFSWFLKKLSVTLDKLLNIFLKKSVRGGCTKKGPKQLVISHSIILFLKFVYFLHYFIFIRWLWLFWVIFPMICILKYLFEILQPHYLEYTWNFFEQINKCMNKLHKTKLWWARHYVNPRIWNWTHSLLLLMKNGNSFKKNLLFFLIN